MQFSVVSKIDVKAAYQSIPVLTSAINTLEAVKVENVSDEGLFGLIQVVCEILNSERQSHRDLLAKVKAHQAAFDRTLLNQIHRAYDSAQKSINGYERARKIEIDRHSEQVETLKAKGFDSHQIEQIAPYPHELLAEMAQQQADRISLVKKIDAFFESPFYDIDLLSGTIFEEAV